MHLRTDLYQQLDSYCCSLYHTVGAHQFCSISLKRTPAMMGKKSNHHHHHLGSCHKLVSSGNTVSGAIGGPHVMPTRSVPRPPMSMVGMQRMQPQGIPAYNLASQAGMGGGMHPGGIPMQRGVASQVHQQQQMRRKDSGMGMPGYPPQQKPRRF